MPFPMPNDCLRLFVDDTALIVQTFVSFRMRNKPVLQNVTEIVTDVMTIHRFVLV